MITTEGVPEFDYVGPGLVIRPGDTLVVGLRDTLDARDAEDLRQRFLDRMTAAGIEFEVVLVSGVEELAVYRPNDGGGVVGGGEGSV